MNEFLEHVKEGLSQTPKRLSSRYFYDKEGDLLFQKIMQLKEYYLPACEMDIIENQSAHIAQDLKVFYRQWQLIELGAGDGSKTKHLLQNFVQNLEEVEYVALDISEHILGVNYKEVTEHIPEINHSTLVGDYHETFPHVTHYKGGRLMVFLGSNIGNFSKDQAVDFFRFIRSGLKPNDFMLVAFDMAKHPRKILKAYDDEQGVTKAFNLNLLVRINRELGGDFDVHKFDHFPFYNPIKGEACSQIISLEQQTVHLVDGSSYDFEAFEAIHTEISKKYFPKDIEAIAEESKMKIFKYYFDQHKEYAFVLFQYAA